MRKNQSGTLTIHSFIQQSAFRVLGRCSLRWNISEFLFFELSESD